MYLYLWYACNSIHSSFIILDVFIIYIVTYVISNFTDKTLLMAFFFFFFFRYNSDFYVTFNPSITIFLKAYYPDIFSL
jgi:hypothetical protein